jgi:hypothetical protein
VDSVVAVGATFDLSARTLDASGATLAADVTWSSSAQNVALVDATGTVGVLGEGPVRIRAEAGNAVASFDFRGLAVDEAAVLAPLEDPLTPHLVGGLNATRSVIQTRLDQVESALETGDLVAVKEALVAVEEESATATDPDDVAILGVLSLLTSHARRALGL